MLRRQTIVAAAAAAATTAACHVRLRSELTRPIATQRVLHPEGAVARRPALVWTELGALRFVEPLDCPSEEIVRQHTAVETEVRPNLATFTVGVITAAASGVMLTSGLLATDRGSSPYTYVGLAGLGVGLPLVIGPWIGNHTELRAPDERSAAPMSIRRPGPSQPCGDRPLAARSATLEVSGLQIHGAIDRDGRFAISPFQWIDAYNAAAVPAAAVAATIDHDGGARTLEAVLETRAIARHAAAYLARAEVDAAVVPLKLVPGIVAGALDVSLQTTEAGVAVRVVLPLRNTGPGDASGVRGQITAPAVPAIDGRMIYVGKLARGAAVARALVIPIAPAAAAALRGATIELSVELRDAHGTAPTTPIRFRGSLRDASR
jgi:hypothetical protein